MRIGVMTWFTYHNYGTALQVTALTEKMRSSGNEVTVINYDPDLWQHRNTETRDISKISAARKLRRILGKLKRKLFRNDDIVFAPKEREDKFNEFLNAHISLTDKANTMNEIENVAEDFDVIVCGSDQIWSPLCFDPHYYLDFVHNNAKKLAYAPSINTIHVKDNAIKKQIIDLAGEFEFISVRERKPAEVLSYWLNKDVKAVLDPALLLDGHEWEKYIPASVSNNTCGAV